MSKSEPVMRTQRRKKMLAVERFGGKCQRCGYDRCIDALEFHHVDESTKEIEPSYAIMRWSWDRAVKELEKCVLICSNCHREVHAKNMLVEMKSLIRPWLTKQCIQCNREFQTKDYEHKCCSLVCNSILKRKVVRPSKSELEKMIKSTSWTEIGRVFGVSDNAVRKWARKYELI